MDFSNGYKIVDAENASYLDELRNQIFELTKIQYDFEHDNPEFGFNKLHKLAKSMTETEFNEKRVRLIESINNEVDCGELIFNSFQNQIRGLLGNDILVQKNCNLVLQMPNDPNPSEIHRDAPANSCYELVVWVPLVDCFNTKAMYILNHQDTKAVYNSFTGTEDWSTFEKQALSLSQRPAVNFGQALMFSTAVLHGSEINQEQETRVSLNIRFKNIFSPAGLKNQYQFFKQLTISDFTKIGADLELDVILSK